MLTSHWKTIFFSIIKLSWNSYILRHKTPDQDKAVFETLVFVPYGDDPFNVKQIFQRSLTKHINTLALFKLETAFIILYIQYLTHKGLICNICYLLSRNATQLNFFCCKQGGPKLVEDSSSLTSLLYEVYDKQYTKHTVAIFNCFLFPAMGTEFLI